MKLFIAATLMAFSLSSFASWNEVECDGRHEGKTIRLEVERPFPTGSHFKRAELTVTADGAQETEQYTVTSRKFGFNKVRYTGGGLRLEVDLWPDQAPRWGRTYRAEI